MLSLIFGFDDKQPTLQITYWLFNFARILLFTTIALVLHFYVQKVLAKKYGCKATVDLWKVQRVGFRKKLNIHLTKKQSITYLPIGILLSVMIYIFSYGQIFFAAITSLNITINKAYRIGKKFINLTNFESAKIAVSGPLVNILLALIATPFSIPLIKPFITINIAIAISYMLPLPGIDGGTVFFGSKPLYVISAVFIGLIAVLMNFINVMSSFVIAGLFALIALISYLFYGLK